MKNVYACLLGNWVNLNESDVIIDNQYTDVNLWYKEKIQDLYEYDYINIQYNNKVYRISPVFIQIVHQ